jgi:acetylornithine deacetylase
MEIPGDTFDTMTCVEILTRMVAFDTVNASISHKTEPERELAIYLESLASSWGLASRRCPVPSGGFNLFLSCEVSADAPWLLFDSHLDTVSTEGMVIDPLHALFRDGRVYGRGACDTKGSGAAMLWALRQYSECKQRRLNVGLLFSVDEEAGMTGAEALT